MKKKILQKIANKMVKRVEEATDPELLAFYYDRAVWFNDFCIGYFEIYLD